MVQQASSLLGKTGSAACPAARGLPAVLCSAAPLPSLCCAAPLHFSVRDLVPWWWWWWWWCILTAGMCAIASLSYTFCHPPQGLPKYFRQ